MGFHIASQRPEALDVLLRAPQEQPIPVLWGLPASPDLQERAGRAAVARGRAGTTCCAVEAVRLVETDDLLSDLDLLLQVFEGRSELRDAQGDARVLLWGYGAGDYGVNVEPGSHAVVCFVEVTGYGAD